MKRNKLGIISTMLIAGIVLGACSTKNKADADTDNGDKKSSITWMAMLHTPAPPSGDITEKLEEYTGVDIEFNWIPDASKDERINAALASKSLADIVSLTQIDNTTIRTALASGMFWDVEPYLKDYPNLANISKERLDSARISGHIYGVPIQNAIARYGVLVRKDWLDNLGLEVPHTYAELKKVAQAFTENDPDGNGQKDTVGFVDRKESFKVGFRAMAINFGAGNNFAVVDDEIIPSFMQPEFKEAMKWYKEIYENGWMNSDFTVMAKEDQKDYIAQGKGGIVISGLYDARNYKLASEGTEEENQEWALINDITYENVERRTVSDTNGGMGGWLAIPKSNVKTEDDLKIVLKFINDMCDETPYTLMTQGEKDIHYTVTEDGAYKRLDDTKWQQEVQPFSSSRPSSLEVFKSTDEMTNESNKLISENEDYAVINPAQSLDSETYTTQWSALSESVEDAYYKYMMGEIDMQGFDDAVSTFLKSGGQDIINEFTASYKENN